MDENEYNEMIKTCLRCSICKWIPQLQIKSQKYATICPAIDMYNFHPYSGGGKIILALSLQMGRIKPTEELRDLVYKCTVCGGCAVSCKFLNNLEPLEIINQLRENLVKAGCGPMPKQQEYIEAVKNVNNPYNEPHNKRTDWLPKDIQIDPNSKTLFFVGCTASYRRKEMAIAVARILNAVGIKFRLLDDEVCCGSPILRAGDKESFLESMKSNLDAIEEQNIEGVVFACSGCFDTFKVDYSMFRNYNFKVIHATELFNELIESGELKLTNKVPLTVTYHDPCHLGRNAERYEEWDGDIVPLMPLVSIAIPQKPKRCGAKGIYDAPRRILSSIPGLKLVEMERIKEYSYCCGAGGGVKSAFPELALNTARTRLEEAESTGVDALISACPFCSTNFQDAIQEYGSKLKYYDINELILLAIGKDLEKFKEIVEEIA
ncbi:MAG: (Fe-S)-binding protein [Promethearchaeota archaeon]